jgi:hypothetical protein
MWGVYLVAAELSKRKLIALTTSRNAGRADILVTDEMCLKTFSVQVKTNSTGDDYWLMDKQVKEMVSDSHIYVFVKLEKEGQPPKFYAAPAKFVAHETIPKEYGDGVWYWILESKLRDFENWKVFGINE